MVTGSENRKRILRSCHFEASSGHFGVTKTWHRISERYYWKGLYQDVVDMVNSFFVACILIMHCYHRLSVVMFVSR